ncbi:MAG: transglycosylase domain-containing protein [Bdellovibrio sp.]|nr:transglycosylase domain-containing protein [Bdellovibrio sp.]
MSSVLFFSATAHAFEWPFSSDSEIQKKLSSRELIASTRYFARGPTFFVGQKWSESDFLKSLIQQNYRVRESDQNLLVGDAKKVAVTECQAFTQISQLTEAHSCWAWQTHEKENFLVIINSEKIIESTWTGAPFQAYWKASLDPVLVAQYRGQEPIMQNERKISDFPVNCLNAVMAIEDNDFLDHSGVSYTGLARAFVKNIVKMRAAQGGSTITQQLVKNYFLTSEKTIKRKVKELFLASKVESEWTKDEILETYLNIIYMGQTGAFQVRGFGAAANVYFDKEVQNLDLHECALLAAIINNPAQNNPWKKSEKSLARRNLVLTKMRELNLITQTEFDHAHKAALPPIHTLKAVETAPYFFDGVRKQMKELNIEVEGASIQTSLDLEAQARAQKALLAHITELEKRRKNLQTNKEKGFRLEGLVVSSENSTGLVNVFVGGQSYRQTQFNRALNGHRQIGSLIKPFVYLTALTYGFDGRSVDPQTKIMDEKFVWKYDNNKTWSPTNYEKKFNGEIPLYFALKESLNSPTAQVAQKVGIQKMIDIVDQIGFTSKMETTPSTSLGATEHYPIEVLEAYRTLANFGSYQKSSFIEKLEDRDGKVIYTFAPAMQKKLDEKNVAVLVGMMKETFRSGTAKSSVAYGWTAPSAGKTGTTSDNKDAWFSGFTPHQTSLAWIGYDQSLSSQLTGASGPVPVWIELMKSYQSVWPDDDFKWPEGVEKREVNLHGTDKKTELIFKD